MLVAYKVLSALTVLAGAGGMGLSFLSMACADLPNIVAGGAGFVAGAILVGAGLVALALFSLVPAGPARTSIPEELLQIEK